MNIEIIPFNQTLSKYFTSLNIAWLQKYFTIEPIDHEMLSDPKKYIIDKGGYIFFAKADEKIVGTFALIKTQQGVYELSKMAVDASFQGQKMGNLLLQFCLEECRRLEAAKIILYSNTKLEPAIHLYKKFGFKEVQLVNTDYKRANIQMEINLK